MTVGRQHDERRAVLAERVPLRFGDARAVLGQRERSDGDRSAESPELSDASTHFTSIVRFRWVVHDLLGREKTATECSPTTATSLSVGFGTSA